MLEVQACVTEAGFGEGCWEYELRSYACVAGTLATDSSPQLQDFLFQEIKYDFNQTIFTS